MFNDPFNNNRFIVNIKTDPTEVKPYYLTISYEGDKILLERILNVYKGHRLCHFPVLIILFRRWCFKPEYFIDEVNEVHGTGFLNSYTLDSLLTPLDSVLNERINFTNIKHAEKAKKDIQTLLNKIVIQEAEKLREVTNY